MDENKHESPGNGDSHHPRLARFKSQGAAAVFAAVMALDDASRWDVLRAVQERLAVPKRDKDTATTRRAAAIRAVREACELSGDASISLNRYEQLRLNAPERDWPSARQLKRWLGASSWNDVLRSAHLDAQPDGDALIVPQGPAINTDEASAALRECASELEHVPTLGDYLHWARQPAVRIREGRRPMSQGPFDRLFGSFSKALVAAQLTDERGRSVGPLYPSYGMLRGSAYRIGPEQIREDIGEVARRLGRAPRSQEYRYERTVIYDETKAQGHPRALVSYGTIARKYRCWDDALVDAGVPPLGGRATGKGRRGIPGRKGPRIGDYGIAAAIQEAYDTLGEPFTASAYSRWREAEIAANPRRRTELPSYYTIWRRLETWDAAVSFALAAQEANLDPTHGAAA
jgi:hypothetical protein